MNTKFNNSILELDGRAREVFREIVETYIETGEPVGSRTLAQKGIGFSPATIRNTMADLVSLGLLDAPHISAGRAPTHQGLRLFVDGLLEVTNITTEDKRAIDRHFSIAGDDISHALSEVSSMLSGVAGGAGLVTTPKRENAISHVEFVKISPEQTLVVLVFDDGSVENRLVQVPYGFTASQLQESTNFLNHHLKGRTLGDAIGFIHDELNKNQRELDEITQRLINDGLAVWAGSNFEDERKLIVRGRSNLLKNADLSANLERVRILFDELEEKKDLIQLLDAARDGTSVKLFIGSENPLFALSGSALIAAPYLDAQSHVVGALGVIGPTRINYARIIPIVDYTAKILSKMMEKRRLIPSKGVKL